MPLLIILGILVAIIGTVIFIVNKRESDRFIEMQSKNNRREEAENLNTFNSNPEHHQD
ncbi:MAG: hypothetical protein Q4C80_03765 [Bacillota bacterium]|nr:hypothetical protein [Bacillota bacterium]